MRLLVGTRLRLRTGTWSSIARRARHRDTGSSQPRPGGQRWREARHLRVVQAILRAASRPRPVVKTFTSCQPDRRGRDDQMRGWGMCGRPRPPERAEVALAHAHAFSLSHDRGTAAGRDARLQDGMRRVTVDVRRTRGDARTRALRASGVLSPNLEGWTGEPGGWSAQERCMAGERLFESSDASDSPRACGTRSDESISTAGGPATRGWLGACDACGPACETRARHDSDARCAFSPGWKDEARFIARPSRRAGPPIEKAEPAGWDCCGIAGRRRSPRRPSARARRSGRALLAQTLVDALGRRDIGEYSNAGVGSAVCGAGGRSRRLVGHAAGAVASTRRP